MCGVVRCGAVQCGAVWCGVVWCVAMRRGAMRCGTMRSGVVWCNVMWCGAVQCGGVWGGVLLCFVGCVVCAEVRSKTYVPEAASAKTRSVRLGERPATALPRVACWSDQCGWSARAFGGGLWEGVHTLIYICQSPNQVESPCRLTLLAACGAHVACFAAVHEETPLDATMACRVGRGEAGQGGVGWGWLGPGWVER